MEVVTGATGCIGNVLTRGLLRKGKKVKALIRATSDLSSLEGLEVEKVLGNILDKDSLIKAFDGAYDFVDVRDVAAGLILAAEKGKTGDYYILSGQRITLDEIFSILEAITGNKSPKYKVPFWLAKTAGVFTPIYYNLANKTPRFTIYSVNTLRSNSYISHEKASRELGYKPITIKESIEDTFEWLRENKIV